MDPEQFFTASGVIIVAGKGGVGKTAVTGALAFAASSVGVRTLIVEIEGKSGLAAAFGSDQLRYDEIDFVDPGEGHGGVTARTLTPDDALVEYLHDHGMKRISNRLVSTGALDMVSTAVPGIRDILVLGKIKQLERGSDFDLIIVDAPAAGHAISFLRSASGLADAVKVGPINNQAKEVLELLNDPTRCRVMLVTLPEETPVNELIETAYSVEDEVGLALGPVVINGLLPRTPGLDVSPEAAAEEVGVKLTDSQIELLRDAAAFRISRAELQDRQLHRLAQDLPLPQLRLPQLFTSQLGLDEITTLADALIEQINGLSGQGIGG
ncbi:MAG TPA: ArsA-related P-loop ATPase [Microthrixaceae bacterium]|nr:ArsA-related P-loop ATPase [Microthrixaceae bacterium]